MMAMAVQLMHCAIAHTLEECVKFFPTTEASLICFCQLV